MSFLKKTPIIGVMGPGRSASAREIKHAKELGRLIAEKGWWVLTGGVNSGVMDAALKGAKEYNSKCVTIGILPHRGEIEKISEYADIIIPTGMGEGRNNLNVLTSHFIVSCCDNLWDSPGTMSEVIFAVKHKKPFIGLCYHDSRDINTTLYLSFLSKFPAKYTYEKQSILNNPDDVVKLISLWM